MNEQTKIEINLSSSALSHGGCMLELYRTIVQGYKEPRPTAAMVYGVAVHKYREVMFKTKGHIPTATKAAMDAFRIPKEDNYKSQHLSDEKHMITTAFNFWEMYVSKDSGFDYLELNGVPAVELSFSLPYYEDDLFRVNLAGTLDGLGKIKGGCFSIADLKTTSSWDDKNYFKSYELSCQLRFYRFVLSLMAERFPDSILGKVGATNVGAFIDALFIKPAANENKYKRSEVFQFSDAHMREFKVTLDRFIEHMCHAFQNPESLTREGILTKACIKGYGKLCVFFNVCANDESGKLLLARDFIQKPFDPLHYSD